MKTAIIICTRLNSSRLPGKPLKNINGKPLLEHLLFRLKDSGIPVILASPEEDAEHYGFLSEKFENVQFMTGFADDPLRRMYGCMKRFNVEQVIRITHDKILIEPEDILKALDRFKQLNLDYLYSSTIQDGSRFEIISRDAIEEACGQFKKIEHISYAIKAVTKNTHDMEFPKGMDGLRLLIDYPEDLCLFELLFQRLGNGATREDVYSYVKDRQWACNINRLPLITVYTCAYNAEKYIEAAMASVERQKIFPMCEYLLIDDFSSDQTVEKIARFSNRLDNVFWIRNQKNMGLASSSNVAVSNARGEYVVRLDADDYFVGTTALEDLYYSISHRNLDALYPNNYYGSALKVQNGKENHHVGGAIFKTRSLNHIRFTEKLRGHDSLDLYLKARKQLDIGYLNKPVFLYRQHSESLSKNNLEERERLKKTIEARHG